MPQACTFLHERAGNRTHQFAMPPASRTYTYSAESCPNAHSFLYNFVRWSSFCDKYQPQDCELAASIVRTVAARNRIS